MIREQFERRARRRVEPPLDEMIGCASASDRPAVQRTHRRAHYNVGRRELRDRPVSPGLICAEHASGR